MTCAPCRASSRAVGRPMPLFAPVTMADLPLRSGMEEGLHMAVSRCTNRFRTPSLALQPLPGAPFLPPGHLQPLPALVEPGARLGQLLLQPGHLLRTIVVLLLGRLQRHAPLLVG